MRKFSLKMIVTVINPGRDDKIPAGREPAKARRTGDIGASRTSR